MKKHSQHPSFFWLFFILICTFIIIMGTIFPIYALQQGIQNGGFEAGQSSPWITSYSQVVSTQKHTGNYSAQVGTVFELEGTLDYIFNPQIIIANVTNFKMWFKKPMSQDFHVQYWVGNTGSGYNSIFETTVYVGESWQEFNGLSALQGTGYTYLYKLRFLHKASYTTTYVDDVVLEGNNIFYSPPLGYDITPVIQLIVPILFLIVPALVLADIVGMAGLVVGLLIGTILLYMVGWLPIWTVFLIGLGVILLILRGRSHAD